MKKLLLSLGSVAAAVSPIAAVISCGISGGTSDPAEFEREMKEAVDEINNSNLSQSEKNAKLKDLGKIGKFAGFEEKINAIIHGNK